MLLNTRENYGLISQVLHWTTAALILTLLPLGLYMHELPESSAAAVVDKAWLYSLHKTLGVSVFLVAIVRVIWTAVQPHPKLLNAEKKLESLAAQTVHWMLYGTIILMPLTGWLHHSASEGFAPIWWPLPQDLPLVPKNSSLAVFFEIAHFFTGILLGLAVVLHMGGALKHALIDRDATLRRMIPGAHQPDTAELADPHFRRFPAFLAVLSFLILGSAVVAGYTINKPDAERVGSTLAPANYAATGWLVDKTNSRLAIQIVQMGNPVSGGFSNWNAAINFDPEDLEAASVEVEVDIASLSLGGVSEQAIGANFLNAIAHPVARFVSESFISTGTDSYEASGRLTLAGQSQPTKLPFTLRIVSDRAFVEGEVTIDRLAFGIGEIGFSGDGQLGFGVLVKVTLEAERAPSS